ncbi:hypothetical protein VMCG_06948 [Cytospora schulzeri]|uniref:Serine hydrolase domain-containing protein n=1 Tax=Cytospora schulzeri TaxID=448051 RepID=A0A423W255_9PEZI|nr:hypothetical protein VMCG_06948 [Valsa malicola]
MKYLCLPGAYGSAKNFQVQLSPFVAEMEKRGNANFKWTQGTSPATPPEGFEDYFGAGPLWRFIEYDGDAAFDIVDRIRDFPEGSNPEDTMRLLFGSNSSCLVTSVQNATQRLLDMIDADPEIEGVLGYSEGATTAATLILEERKRAQQYGRQRRIKRAIFFAGWPPMSISGDKVQVVLADQSQGVIDIPTLHIVGCSDPYILGAVALYNMCERSSAEMFDHGKGHTVPRDSRTIQELCDSIDRLASRDESWQDNDLRGLQVLDRTNLQQHHEAIKQAL